MPVSSWQVPLISRMLGHLEGEQSQLGNLPTMVYLPTSTATILQVLTRVGLLRFSPSVIQTYFRSRTASGMKSLFFLGISSTQHSKKQLRIM